MTMPPSPAAAAAAAPPPGKYYDGDAALAEVMGYDEDAALAEATRQSMGHTSTPGDGGGKLPALPTGTGTGTGTGTPPRVGTTRPPGTPSTAERVVRHVRARNQTISDADADGGGRGSGSGRGIPLTPGQQQFLQTVTDLHHSALPRLSSDDFDNRRAANEIDLPLLSLVSHDGTVKTDGTLPGASPAGSPFDEVPPLWIHPNTQKVYQMTAIIDADSDTPYIRYHKIDFMDQEEAAALLQLRHLQKANEREVTDVFKDIYLAIPRLMLDASDSGTPGIYKKPLNKLTDLHDHSLTDDEKEAHIQAITGSAFYYDIVDEDGLIVDSVLVNKPEDVCIHDDLGHYDTAEVAMLLMTFDQQILSKHLFPIGYKNAPGLNNSDERNDGLKEAMARYPMLTLGFYATRIFKGQANDKFRPIAHTDLIPGAGNHVIGPGGTWAKCRGGKVSFRSLAAMTNAIIIGYYWKLIEDDAFFSTWWKFKPRDPEEGVNEHWRFEGCHAGCENEMADCENFWHVFLGSSDVNKINIKCPGFLRVQMPGGGVQWVKVCQCDAPGQRYGGNPGHIPCMKMRIVTNMQYMPLHLVGSTGN